MEIPTIATLDINLRVALLAGTFSLAQFNHSPAATRVRFAASLWSSFGQRRMAGLLNGLPSDYVMSSLDWTAPPKS
ncbi:hypothetical protein [Paraburkholderia sp. BCC1884]|uniref:hypothetical protein n=1 Tax=Paraburkholderia sp. BCC1884 TaxID=2562668 RepID=UPI001183165E|nr:hypothetical protein [Paraburkholderia sp. BCC1884]